MGPLEEPGFEASTSPHTYKGDKERECVYVYVCLEKEDGELDSKDVMLLKREEENI